MGTKTTRLDLLKPGENDYYNQQTEQADNWQKVDDYAVYTDRDKNGIWGGLDGGGLIEDPSVTKIVGKRYIGADGKAYICLVPSNINNSTNYAPCNVVDNLDKLQNLFGYSFQWVSNATNCTAGVAKVGNICFLHGTATTTVKFNLPEKYRPAVGVGVPINTSNTNSLIADGAIDIATNGDVNIRGITQNKQFSVMYECDK